MSPGEAGNGQWIFEDWHGQTRFALNVLDWLHDEQSAYQRIQVIDTQVYGRVLVLDGIFQTSEQDEHFYHEMLVQPAMCTAAKIERALIIGGGDGGTAREVLRHQAVKELVMVEIDERVVCVARQFLPEIGTGFADPRLQLRFENGVQYVHDAPSGSFDVIILDGSDPVGPSTGLFGIDFYRQCKRVLKPDGVFALQSESFFQTDTLWHEIQSTLQQVFKGVHPYLGMAPLYSTGTWSWTLCGQALEPLDIINERAAVVEAHTRYYNRDIHRSAFTLPNDLCSQP
ncbi:MAG: spermidine synthase [Gammaproteobacteria bacterium]|jgi:spermidine synthase